MKAIIGRKVGMTRMFNDQGVNIPVTVIEAGPCQVSQIKTEESDGYAAIQFAFEDVPARRATQQIIGHDAKAGLGPKYAHREVRVDSAKISDYALGQEITVKDFEDVKYVDVVGTSKGKGFQGVMVRHNFKGMFASHGTERKHRSPGSIGGGGTERGRGPKPRKGKKMPGHMGSERVTARNLDVVKIVPEKNLIYVKGAVPGAPTGLLYIRSAIRLGKSKANKLAAS